MEELWYPPEPKYVPRGGRVVSEKQVDFLSNPKVGRGKAIKRRKFKVGQVYKTSQSDVEVIHYQGGDSICVKMLDSGMIIEHYPVRAVFSMKKQPKEKQPMQATQQQQIAEFNKVTAAQPITFGLVPAVPQSEEVTMTSLELVDFINALRAQEGGYTPLRHNNFLAKVENVLGNHSAKFQAEYKDVTGRTLKCFKFPKREATLMAMSYSNEISAQVYDKMEALEKQVKGQSTFQVPQTFHQALLLAAEQQQHIEAQQAALALAAPKVEFVDRFVSHEGVMTATDIAKKLGTSATMINRWLVKVGALYRTRTHFKQAYVNKGYGTEKFTDVINGQTRHAKYHTNAGADWVIANFGKDITI